VGLNLLSASSDSCRYRRKFSICFKADIGSVTLQSTEETEGLEATSNVGSLLFSAQENIEGVAASTNLGSITLVLKKM
jgi:hypothetical protein